MSRLEITGIKIDSESDIESITINISYRDKEPSTQVIEPISPSQSLQTPKTPINSQGRPFQEIKY